MKIKYTHYRIPWYLGDRKRGSPDEAELILYSRHFPHLNTYAPCERGGKTVCTIEDGNGNKYIGKAVCSYSDNFCYELGRRIAYGRAEKQYVLSCDMKEHEMMVR